VPRLPHFPDHGLGNSLRVSLCFTQQRADGPRSGSLSSLGRLGLDSSSAEYPGGALPVLDERSGNSAGFPSSDEMNTARLYYSSLDFKLISVRAPFGILIKSSSHPSSGLHRGRSVKCVAN